MSRPPQPLGIVVGTPCAFSGADGPEQFRRTQLMDPPALLLPDRCRRAIESHAGTLTGTEMPVGVDAGAEAGSYVDARMFTTLGARLHDVGSGENSPDDDVLPCSGHRCCRRQRWQRHGRPHRSGLSRPARGDSRLPCGGQVHRPEGDTPGSPRAGYSAGRPGLRAVAVPRPPEDHPRGGILCAGLGEGRRRPNGTGSSRPSDHESCAHGRELHRPTPHQLRTPIAGSIRGVPRDDRSAVQEAGPPQSWGGRRRDYIGRSRVA